MPPSSVMGWFVTLYLDPTPIGDWHSLHHHHPFHYMSQSSSSTSSRTPRQLPGYYWDEEQQKYFPLVSRPLGAAVTKRVTPANHAPCLSPNDSSKYHPDSPETHLESTQEVPQKTETWKRDEMQLRQWMMSELRTKPYDHGRANSMRQ